MTRYDIARMCGYNSVEEYEEAEKRKHKNEIFTESLKKQKPCVEKESVNIQPVVHCKDCKYRKECSYEEKGEKPYIKYECKFTKYSMSDDGFCSFGVKKDDVDEKLSCHFEHCRDCLSLIKHRIPDTEVTFEIRCGRKHKGIVLKGEQLLSFGDITPEDFDKAED